MFHVAFKAKCRNGRKKNRWDFSRSRYRRYCINMRQPTSVYSMVVGSDTGHLPMCTICENVVFYLTANIDRFRYNMKFVSRTNCVERLERYFILILFSSFLFVVLYFNRCFRRINFIIIIDDCVAHTTRKQAHSDGDGSGGGGIRFEQVRI